jgi:hypothetical protein
MRTSLSPLARGLALASVLLALGCLHRATTERASYPIRIELSGGCPARAVPPRECREHPGAACVSKTDSVGWTSEGPFRVLFDPFLPSIASTCRDRVCSTPAFLIPEQTPPLEGAKGGVEYKYTVTVDGCPTPLDPPIFIQH